MQSRRGGEESSNQISAALRPCVFALKSIEKSYDSNSPKDEALSQRIKRVDEELVTAGYVR
jgi:hypothetical protein